MVEVAKALVVGARATEVEVPDKGVTSLTPEVALSDAVREQYHADLSMKSLQNALNLSSAALPPPAAAPPQLRMPRHHVNPGGRRAAHKAGNSPATPGQPQPLAQQPSGPRPTVAPVAPFTMPSCVQDALQRR